MNLKKILVSLATIFMLVVFISLQGMTYASTGVQEPIYMGITELMSNNEPYMGYSINKPGDANSAKIWKIIKYTSDDGKFIDSNYNNIYCVKAGVGFTTITNSGEIAPRPYNISFNMKTEREQIKSQNEILKELVEKTITLEDGTTFNRYDAMLAIMDMMYLPGDSTEEEKNNLINNIINYAIDLDNYNSYVELMRMYPLTDDDIVAVQQAALWYFTNYGENGDMYNKVGKTGWLNYTLDGTTYDNLSDYNPVEDNKEANRSRGLARSTQAEVLYNYIINKAVANANKYANSSLDTEKPAQVNTTTLKYTESGENYIVGPINITENASSAVQYTIDFIVKNNETETSNYVLLNSDKTEATGKTVKDLIGNDFYISIPKINEMSIEVDININYRNTSMTLWASTTNNQEQPLAILEKDTETVPTNLKLNINEPEKIFDLALRKYITKINDKELTELGLASRVPSIDEATLISGTTATYKHRKDPITVVTGDTVTYKLTIYNEGEKSGRATKIVDQLPEGLEFSKVASGNFDLYSYNRESNTLQLKKQESNTDNLPVYTEGNLSSETVEIECKVTAKADSKDSKVLTNVAWIAEAFDAEDEVTIINQKDFDIDSEPGTVPDVNKNNMSNYSGKDNKEDLSDSNYFYKGEQDDDDFEKLVLLPEAFDLKLIKRITAVNDEVVPERIKSIDVSKLNIVDSNGNINKTTAIYDLDKEPVGVKKDDIITYTFRIYNEGTIDGYVQEITEDIPEGLEFLWSEKEGEELEADTTLTDEEKEAIDFNQQYLWGNFVYDESRENIIQISSDYLSLENETTVGGNLIKAFGKNDGTKTENDLSYKEISVKFKVISENVVGTIIRNEAAITEDVDKDGEPVDDRDSDTEEWKKYEDDEDYDNVVLQSFDLALRKFIIAVSNDTEIEDSEELRDEDGSYTRAPVVDTSKLNTLDENGKLITTAIYNHTKEPILVKQNDIVVYMLRVYNEGDRDGYAAEITDYLPEYLEFVENEFNAEYEWEVSEDGRTVTTRYLENSLIKAAEEVSKSEANDDEDSNMETVEVYTEYKLDYKEVPIMCKVKDTAKTGENITNIAEITEYLDKNKKIVTDRDSQSDNVNLPTDEELPQYKDDEIGSYIPGQQDDDDFEKVIVRTFDLALRKWVTEAIVIEDGKQTVTQTGHKPYDDPEEIVKVELHRKKINNVTVKFKYSIRVINEGDIEGYAKEVTDYVPQGLKFVAEDNPGWTDEGNNVISTRLLENTLLKPGEYADVEVTLTWINSQDNIGVMKNVAEISEDYNEKEIPDKDSTPDNKKEGEDDIDDAPVMLAVSTGQIRIYFTLGFMVLITIAGGVILIKKFVL